MSELMIDSDRECGVVFVWKWVSPNREVAVPMLGRRKVRWRNGDLILTVQRESATDDWHAIIDHGNERGGVLITCDRDYKESISAAASAEWWAERLPALPPKRRKPKKG